MSNSENIKSREFFFFWPIWSTEHKLGRDKSAEQMLAGGEQISLEYRLQWEKKKIILLKLSKRSVDGRGREYKLCAHHFLSLLGEEEVLVGGGNILHLSKIFSDVWKYLQSTLWQIFCTSAKYSHIFLHLAKYLAQMFLIVENYSFWVHVFCKPFSFAWLSLKF